MTQFWNSFLSDESGQGFTEYALILALVGIGLVTVLTLLRDDIGTVLDAVRTELQGAPAGEYTTS